METVKDLKQKILMKLIDQGIDVDKAKAEITAKYKEMADSNPIFASNKQIAYNIIARDYDVDVESTLATSGKKAFPLKIGEILESEKANFDISGYLIRDPRTFVAKKSGKEMMYVEVADDTGIQTFSVFNDGLVKWFGTDEKPLEFLQGDFVSVHNLYWKDKNDGYTPSFGQYASLSKAEPTFEYGDIIVNPIPSMVEGKYYTIKGIVTYLPEANKKQVYHCSTGHWFSGKTDDDIAELSMCEKCKKPMEVMKDMVVDGLQFADANGVATVKIGTFCEMKDIGVMEEYVLTGQFREGVFETRSAIPLTKKN